MDRSLRIRVYSKRVNFYGKLEVLLHAFLTSTVGGGEGQASSSVFIMFFTQEFLHRRKIMYIFLSSIESQFIYQYLEYAFPDYNNTQMRRRKEARKIWHDVEGNKRKEHKKGGFKSKEITQQKGISQK